jgi:hypothetical protein
VNGSPASIDATSMTQAPFSAELWRPRINRIV